MNQQLNDQKIFNIKITYGIHIILDIHHIINCILHKNPNYFFNIEIDLQTLKKNRNDVNEKYLNLYFDLLKEILNIKNVNISINNNFKYVDWVTVNCPLIDKQNIFIRKKNIFNVYNMENISLPNNYICINTKIVNSSIYYNTNKDKNYDFINKYYEIKNKLFKTLNNSGYKIIILGERNIPNCNEYNYHSDNFGNYNMYDDLKKNLNNYIDESYEDSKDGWDLNNWKKTCFYLSNSKFNIYIGNGGGIHLYAYFSNCIQLGVTDRLLNWIPANNIETNFCTIIDNNLFLNKIEDNINYNV